MTHVAGRDERKKVPTFCGAPTTCALPPPHTTTRLLSAAVTALLLNVLHVLLMIIALDAWRRKRLQLMAVPFALHAAFSLMTLFNTVSGGCTATLPLLAVVVTVAVVAAVRIVRAPDFAGTRQMRAWERLVAALDSRYRR